MIALYYRLSGADGDLGKDGKDESNSIENQRALITEFVASMDDLKCRESTEFIDDGYTGSNFRRPSFERMMAGVKAGTVDTIIVKDLSRFGRNYLEVGEYLEEIFPLFDIRFVAVNDRYDSENYKGTTMGIEMVVENLVNSMYSRDIGKKLYSANKVKWERGYSTSGTVPFGYKRNENGRYEIDSDAARIVRRIFDLALEGKNTRQIADTMNGEGHPIPSVYNRLHGICNRGGDRALNPDKIWDMGKVWRILRNEVYTGAMVFGRRQQIAGSQRFVPRSKWFITPDANEAIVSKEEFWKAQGVIRFMKKPSGYQINHFALKGKIRCGHCRCVMAFRLGAYDSNTWCAIGRESRYSGCSSDKYSIKQIEAAVFGELDRYLETLRLLGVHLETRKREINRIERQISRQAEHSRNRIEILKAEKMRSYENYTSGNISLEAFKADKERIDHEITELTEQIRNKQKAVPNAPVCSTEADALIKQAAIFQGEKELTEEMVNAFIECVYIHEGGRMEIVFKCEDEAANLAGTMEVEADCWKEDIQIKILEEN